MRRQKRPGRRSPSRFTEKRLEVLLRELRAHGVAIPYKAMVTAHNLPWTLAALYDELVREHEAMHG